MKYIYQNEDNGGWHKMLKEMPPTTADVEVQSPDGKIIPAEIVVEMSGYYIYFSGKNSHWGDLEDYSYWRFRQKEKRTNMKYIDADRLKAEIDRIEEESRKVRVYGADKEAIGADSEVKLCLKLKSIIDSLRQEQQKLYKDESLGSPDYERGFKHGRDYQTHVERKYTDKDKVIAYLVDKGYPVSTNGEIPTYQETFDMINNAIKHANKQEQPDVDLDEEINRFWDSCIKHKNERGGNVIWSNKIEIEALARYFAEWGAEHLKK